MTFVPPATGLCLTRTVKLVGFTNHLFSVSQFSFLVLKSKSRTIRGINFDISRMEMCFPRHVLVPRPNYRRQYAVYERSG